MRPGHAMKRTFALVFASASILSVNACSSNGSGGTGGASSSSSSSSSASTSGSGPMTPANSCSQPGDHGNSHGVGEYCTPGGGQCAQFPQAGLCLADVGQDQWFCTRISCKMDADCGENATCVMDP